MTYLLRCIAMLVACWLMAMAALLPDRAEAHFSYADPRIVHIAETEAGEIVILIRMPAPLALLPDDWQGAEDDRVPPFGIRTEVDILLDQTAFRTDEARLDALLLSGLTLWSGDTHIEPVVGRVSAWPDADRPSFGTVKSALKALGQPAPGTDLAYFNSTLDVEFLVPGGSLSAPIRLVSDLGQNFEVMDRFGTVVKLHRASGTETAAMIGVLEAEFDAAQSPMQRLVTIAWIGAEHIYLGFDHLAMILLIAIAAIHWRQALLWASAFTIGHVITLAAGLYGYAPQSAWFIPSVELLIVLSIVLAGMGIVLKRPHVMNWPVLFGIGLIHGYGFASAASEALFSGPVDAMALLAFAVGLELCQLAVYLAILPAIYTLDRIVRSDGLLWRRPVAFCLAAAAGISVVQQVMQATGFSAI